VPSPWRFSCRPAERKGGPAGRGCAGRMVQRYRLGLDRGTRGRSSGTRPWGLRRSVGPIRLLEFEGSIVLGIHRRRRVLATPNTRSRITTFSGTSSRWGRAHERTTLESGGQAAAMAIDCATRIVVNVDMPNAAIIRAGLALQGHRFRTRTVKPVWSLGVLVDAGEWWSCCGLARFALRVERRPGTEAGVRLGTELRPGPAAGT